MTKNKKRARLPRGCSCCVSSCLLRSARPKLRRKEQPAPKEQPEAKQEPAAKEQPEANKNPRRQSNPRRRRSPRSKKNPPRRGTRLHRPRCRHLPQVPRRELEVPGAVDLQDQARATLDPRTPFAQLQCETCHGPGAQHAEEVPEGQKQAPIIKFGANSWVPVEKQNQICLGCHEDQSRIAWKGVRTAGTMSPAQAATRFTQHTIQFWRLLSSPRSVTPATSASVRSSTNRRCIQCALRRWPATPATRFMVQWRRSSCSSPR